jgi:hypothetical protein
MAQSKLNDLAGRLGKNPRGLGLGLKLLAVAGAGIYGISQAMFTGTLSSFNMKTINRIMTMVYVIYS